MEYTRILYRKEGYVGVITLNRAEVLNALDTKTYEEITHCLEGMESDKELRCVIITGSGRAFSAGGDIHEEGQLNVRDAHVFMRVGHKFVRAVETFRTPVIAAINGYAMGGGLEFALACDIRLIADTAKVGLPECGLGVLTGWGGAARLSKLVGPAKVKEMLFTGDMLSAQEAYDLRIVNHIYPADQLMDKAMEMANKIASKPPIAIEYAKLNVHHGSQCDLERANEIEMGFVTQLYATEDKTEGFAAFLEKREQKPPLGR